MIRNLIAQCWAATKSLVAQYWAKALTTLSFVVMAYSGMTWWFFMLTDVPEPQDHPELAALTFGAMALTGIFSVIVIKQEEGGSIRSIIAKYFI